MKANSKQQFNKWKAWECGEVKNTDMFILAQTYLTPIHGMCNELGIKLNDLTDDQVFKMVAKRIYIS